MNPWLNIVSAFKQLGHKPDDNFIKEEGALRNRICYSAQCRKCPMRLRYAFMAQSTDNEMHIFLRVNQDRVGFVVVNFQNKTQRYSLQNYNKDKMYCSKLKSML